MRQIIKNRFSEIVNLCEEHDVSRLYTFGSVNSDNFNDTSDIDLIVELNQTDPAEKGETLIKLWDDFEKLFNRKVDLLSSKTVRNPYLQKGINDTIQLVYES